MSELGREARALLEEGKHGDDPTPEDRARTRRALMAAIAAGAAASAAAEGAAAAAEKTAEAAGAAKAAGLSSKLLVGIALVGAVGGGLMLRPSTPEASAPPPAPIEVQKEARAVGTVEKPEAPEPAPSLPAAPAPSAHPTAPPAAKRPAAASKAQPAAEDTLEEETRRLREAHGALNGGNPARALELLDAQSADFAGGQLREERAAARVLALCKLGATPGAVEEARRFLQDNPRSPLADRVRAACAIDR
ncbi:hypothetical protein [Polyangium aurulentum]|uniref:hypothetical protein n=1 Tax=Polyangium aurulentum TaxID=2567896 RepID=UPI0010AE3368|nr:hypothetical protein [Polyangium aurulentum]UQA60850.1 hypothetical protein E8A73_010365 [Polyangium aurulentum]